MTQTLLGSATGDAALVTRIKSAISDLPSYGLRKQAEPLVNVKRVYRVMRDQDLLLEQHPLVLGRL